MEQLGIVNFWVFLGAGILLNITPGPDTFYILGRSVAQGRSAGICSALGIGTGAVIHTLMAAFGLSAVLATSSNAFLAVKTAGAFYLIYLGVAMLLQKSKEPKGAEEDGSSKEGMQGLASCESLWKIYRQGIVTNVLNPKVALFFLSFLPQFVNANAEVQFLPFLVLGVTFITTGTLWCLVIAWLAGTMVRFFSGTSTVFPWFKKVPAVLFIGLGAKLLIEQR